MWIVILALRRPYAVAVMAALIGLLGMFSCIRLPKDIFPSIDIPVVTMIWNLNGLSPSAMERRLTTIVERACTTTVNDIEHIESTTVRGITLIKLFFQPQANVAGSVAQVTAISETLLRILPPGITPPLVIQYNASSVPILQLGLSSKTLTEQAIYDYGLNFVRLGLVKVRGASIPLPYGGRARQIQVDADVKALQARNLTPYDLSNAIGAQNLINPSGTIKMGPRELNVNLVGSPDLVEQLNSIPVRTQNGAQVQVRDVAFVRDGFAVQQNIVAMDGTRSALLQVLKSGSASTLDVVERIKEELPRVQKTVPPELVIKQLFDQSLFVKAAISGVVREGVISAFLTATMILLFLGSWRSTLIVAVSIPLAIMVSICVLGGMGETLNVMTLGGLSLAVGILVDDATVEIENIHRNLHEGKPLTKAILDGAAQIAVPTFVSTLSICMVFVSVVFLTGPAKYLFTPLAYSVVFAMMASYMLSRTLVPVMVRMLLRKEIHLYQSEGEGDGHGHGQAASQTPASSEKKQDDGGPIWRVHQKFNVRFERFREGYEGWLEKALGAPLLVAALFFIGFLLSGVLVFFVGRDFFPTVDAGLFRLKVRVDPNTRIEETERQLHQLENEIRQIVPADKLNGIITNIGTPAGGVNLAFGDSFNVGSYEGELLVGMNEGQKAAPYVRQIRSMVKEKFPGMTAYFASADITNQILNFGIPAPIDIQLSGRSPKNLEVIEKIRREVEKIPGAVDVRLQQVPNITELRLTADRLKAQQLGVTERDLSNNILVALSGTAQAAPNYWIDPKNGVSYPVVVQAQQRTLSNVQELLSIPVAQGIGEGQILGNLVSVSSGTTADVISHYDVQPTFDVYCGVDRLDLGTVADKVNKIVEKASKNLPRGSQIRVRGQADSMEKSFIGLGQGMCFAVLMVYLLMVVNFQSWLDPLIILAALPGALSGVVWMLFITQTPFSVPALMGTIMCIGVATANSILMITFANEQQQEGHDAHSAALSAGGTRLRPVMMTALAMIIGMFPMSLGFGEGGEQNQPLGIAVIGGLLFATFTTLFFVPVVYSRFSRFRPDEDQELDEAIEYEEEKQS